ncbi:MAG TPA: CAP domain-containing protein, partial [Pyrinomonadaceae bacterium]
RPSKPFPVPVRSVFAFLLVCFIGSMMAANAQGPLQQSERELAVSTTVNGPRIVTNGMATSMVAKIVATSGSAVPSFAEATPIERRAFEMINSIRLKNGLPSLNWDPELCKVARSHSRNMASGGFFSHVSPDGFTPKDRVQQAGLKSFRVVGENIAYNQGYDDPGAFAVERWMISPGHRENILNKEYEASAIGVFVNSDGCVYLTELFILR